MTIWFKGLLFYFPVKHNCKHFVEHLTFLWGEKVLRDKRL